MKYLKWLWLCLASQRGEEEGQPSGSGKGSAEGQGAGQAVAEEQQAEEQVVDVEALTKELNEYKTKHETLSGQSRATEQNLAATRRALEANGLRMVKDADGNVQVVPLARQSQGGRFTDEHKNKFFSYFPDQKSGEEFLSILDLMFGDRIDTGLKTFRGEMSKEQEFSVGRQQSIDRMYQIFPQLKQGESFNKAFYEKADRILVERYIDPKTGNPLFPSADLVAANEAAIELGIAPASVAAAEKKGFDKAKEQKKIVGSVQGSQAQGGQGGGFRKLSYEEYSKFTPEQKAEYDKKEIETRKAK